MGEALISRSTTIPEEILNPINPVNGYCVMVIKVKDYDNRPISGLKVTCTAGSQNLTYNTNEKGAVMFTINNGIANVFLNNYLNNNTRICDYGTRWENNVEAPVGTVQNINYQLTRLNNTNLIYWDNYNYIFWSAKAVNLQLSGSGGGAGGGLLIKSSSGLRIYHEKFGGTGGRGYLNSQNNVSVLKGTEYQLSIGNAGSGAVSSEVRDDSWYSYMGTYNAPNGASGGTSYFLGYSANGGKGGGGAYTISGTSYAGISGAGGSGASGGRGTYTTGQPGSGGYADISFIY